MADRDLNTKILGIVSFQLRQIVANGALNGSIIDMSGYESIDFIFPSPPTMGAEFAISIMHDDDSSFATAVTVPSEFVVGDLPSFTTAETNKIKGFGYIGKKRYVRITVTTSNLTEITDFGGLAVFGDLKTEP